MIVELKDGDISGYGEASENPYYHKTLENMIQDLQNCKSIIENDTQETPEEFWDKMYPHLKEDMFALCALDLAYNDLYARKKGKKLYDLWNFDISNNPLTNYTIGIDTIEKMVAKMQETPWPVYKIKLGTKNDIEIVKELRKHSDAIFRIDANCAWTAEETIKNSLELEKLGVEFLEQPLPAEDWEGARKVFLESVLPIIADESCQVESDVEKCHDHFHGINIKLVKCGGLTPARRMLKKAKELDMNKMVGCMTESSIGISAIAHLLPELDYVDMDGAMLLSKDIAEGVTISSGKVTYSHLNGIGVKITNLKPKSII
jgi:L-alanine-DL-glutamate epimerase-like enolase superfamily enzyme